MQVVEDHALWFAVGLALLLALGGVLVILRSRRRSRVAEAAEAQQSALERSKLTQENGDLRERVARLEHEIEWYRGMEAKLGDTLRVAQTTAAERVGWADEESQRIVRRAQAQAMEIIDRARGERDLVRADVERLEKLRDELVRSYRALVHAASELLEEEMAGKGSEAIAGDRQQPSEPATTGSNGNEPEQSRGDEPRRTRPSATEEVPTQEFEIPDLPSLR
jgi:cell division initiation protein